MPVAARKGSPVALSDLLRRQAEWTFVGEGTVKAEMSLERLARKIRKSVAAEIIVMIELYAKIMNKNNKSKVFGLHLIRCEIYYGVLRIVAFIHLAVVRRRSREYFVVTLTYRRTEIGNIFCQQVATFRNSRRGSIW
jgi:hypothetical protein